MKLKKIKINSLVVLTGLIVLAPVVVFAISSANYQVDPLNAGNGGGTEGGSANFKLSEQQVGDVTVDVSTSSNYNLRHGHLYPKGDVSVDFTVVPEKRISTPPLPSPNNGTKVLIYVYNPGGAVPIQVYSYYDTDNDGNYTGLALTGISPGNYDIAVKGYAHLRKRLNNVVLTGGSNSIDFTFSGTEKLLCGDVYVNGVYPDGDNVVNSVDVTYLVSKWAVSDTGVSDERADVDENGQVNSLDMTKTVNNYAVTGD
jgi:hypothetical protein